MSSRNRGALVVDDDATIRNLVNLILIRENFAVETASDGIEAVLKLSVSHYDLVVLDLMMPNLSGREVLDYLSAEHPAMLAHVVVMTAAGDSEIERMLRSRSCVVVRKPFDLNVFAQTIRQCANGGHPSGDIEPPVS